MPKLQSSWQIDWYLVGVAGVLVAIGVASIYSVTVSRGDTILAWNQAGIALLGILFTFALSIFDYRRIRSVNIWLYLGGIGLLTLVLVGGKTIFGANRWIQLPGFQLQPSELMKLLNIFLVGHLLAVPKPEMGMARVLTAILLVGVPVGLILAQPDLGTAAVLVGSVGLLLLAAQLPRSAWALIAGITIVTVPVIGLNLRSYQLERLQTFLSPASDPYGAGYNVLQSLIAVGNGGMFGQGFGYGTQSQLAFLPVAHTDFIFAGIAEATGLLGSVVVLMLFGFLIGRTLVIARNAPDRFGYLLASGIAGLWLVQVAVNVAMNLGVAPVTGIPLPFVSHGGTALAANFLALGVVASIARRSRPGMARIR